MIAPILSLIATYTTPSIDTRHQGDVNPMAGVWVIFWPSSFALIRVIDRLRAPPDDLSTLPVPDIDDPAAYNDALKDLPLPTSLYAATYSDPTSEWSSKVLEWSKTGQSQARIVQWASRGLSEGTFDSQVWFEALADDGNTVLREVFVQWGKDDLTVSNE